MKDQEKFFKKAFQVYSYHNKLLLYSCVTRSKIEYVFQANDNYRRPSSEDRIYAKGIGGVWEFPKGCHQNLNSSACRRITWKPTISNQQRFVMKFNINGSYVGYISLAISVDTRRVRFFVIYYYLKSKQKICLKEKIMLKNKDSVLVVVNWLYSRPQLMRNFA